MRRAAWAIALAFAFAAPWGLARAEEQGVVDVFGKDYVRYSWLAETRGMRLSYSASAGAYVLAQGSRRIEVVPGFDVVRVDGRTVELSAPVLFWNDEMVLPAELFMPRTAGEYGAGGAPLRRVVLDPGHGGQDSGALGASRLAEKQITLDVALRLKARLEARGIEVVMTRSADRYLPLLDRSKIANNSGADLFLSIHCNASPGSEAGGLETFALTWSISDAERAQKAAARMSPSSLVPGASDRVSPATEQAIFGAYLAEQRRQSESLARCIQSEMVALLGEADRGVKVKNLSVLRETYVPAVLAEVGFITCPATAARMRSAAYREKLAEALLSGITRYAGEETARLERISGGAGLASADVHPRYPRISVARFR